MIAATYGNIAATSATPPVANVAVKLPQNHEPRQQQKASSIKGYKSGVANVAVNSLLKIFVN